MPVAEKETVNEKLIGGKLLATAKAELARREALNDLRREILSKANEKQEEAKQLRQWAQRLYHLITNTASQD